MTDQKKEYEYILKNIKLTVNHSFFSSKEVVNKFFTTPEEHMHCNYEIDLNKIKAIDPDYYNGIIDFLYSKVIFDYNASASLDEIKNCSSLDDYASLISKTSDINKYFR
ncbi:hypothetical protein J2X84_000550 [Pseudomonas corrugata]|uniref:hypothetical protein n=1 Tax=Pseudomonas corrugata TaxID=47879 RepID=UPI00285B5B67|nr:hypothetical protein [Pseudomonas corrugata]MDR7281736.1 hypothetical protein [Pseudomonas corrugata]